MKRESVESMSICLNLYFIVIKVTGVEMAFIICAWVYITLRPTSLIC